MLATLLTLPHVMEHHGHGEELGQRTGAPALEFQVRRDVTDVVIRVRDCCHTYTCANARATPIFQFLPTCRPIDVGN